jgi:hypothetical protein
MGLTPRGKLKKDRTRLAEKKEADTNGSSSTMPNRLPQGELSSPAVSADLDLPRMSTPFNTSLSGPLSTINLNSSAGLKRVGTSHDGPSSKFGRPAQLSADESDAGIMEGAKRKLL